jgi:general stress protein 26
VSEPTTKLDRRYSNDDSVATSWAVTRAQLEAAELCWLVTLRPDGRPHATPLVTVWVDDAMHFTTGESEQKAVNLRANDSVLLQTGRLDWQSGIDIVLEGRATLATDDDLLARLAAAWQPRWDGRWQYEARNGSLHHPGGFRVLTFSVRPETVYAYAEGQFGHTVHRF